MGAMLFIFSAIGSESSRPWTLLREQGICNALPTNKNATPGVAFCA